MTSITWDEVCESREPLAESSALMSSSQSFVVAPWNRAREQLLEIRRLDDDWDGLGALAPNRKVVDSAVELLNEWRKTNPDFPPDRILAGPMGEVVIEWQYPGKWLLEIEVEQPGVAEIIEAQSGVIKKSWQYKFAETMEQAVSWGSASVDDQFEAT
jgi:hypothetical protein